MKTIKNLLEDFKVFKIDDDEDQVNLDDFDDNPLMDTEDNDFDLENDEVEFDHSYLDSDNDSGHEDEDMLDSEEEHSDEVESEEDNNFQGVIRTVKGANLVYKRKNPDGDYEELWIYSASKDMKEQARIKRAILAGTDIDPLKQMSEDGSQNLDFYSIGNVEFLKLTGLPN